jgi:hypothetical protein
LRLGGKASVGICISQEGRPEKVQGGTVCSLCQQDNKRIFPTLEALWQDRHFLPPEKWFNTEIAVAEESLRGLLRRGALWLDQVTLVHSVIMAVVKI